MKKRRSPPRSIQTMLDAFESLDDPRIERTRHHSLINIVVMALCGAVAGADGWEALEAFAEARSDWFASFLELPRGTPSADTFRRVLCALDPDEFQAAFRRWVAAFAQNFEGEGIAIDGKTLRGALARASTQSAFHLVHVWATEQRLLLAQKAVPGAFAEPVVIPELLKLLQLRGATITTDANGCTAAITKACREAGADYVLAIKGNRKRLHEHIKDLFTDGRTKSYRTHRDIRKFESTETAHGRTEHRRIQAVSLKEWPAPSKSEWTDVHSAVLVERTRTVGKRTAVERHYYITSHSPDPQLLAKKIRGHWSIENQLHWTLDVTFDEDRRRIRDEIGAQNFALITRAALMMLKRENSVRYGVPIKRKKAAWDTDYLVKVLAGGVSEF